MKKLFLLSCSFMLMLTSQTTHAMFSKTKNLFVLLGNKNIKKTLSILLKTLRKPVKVAMTVTSSNIKEIVIQENYLNDLSNVAKIAGYFSQSQLIQLAKGFETLLFSKKFLPHDVNDESGWIFRYEAETKNDIKTHLIKNIESSEIFKNSQVLKNYFSYLRNVNQNETLRHYIETKLSILVNKSVNYKLTIDEEADAQYLFELLEEI